MSQATYNCLWGKCSFSTSSGPAMRAHIRDKHATSFKEDLTCRCLWKLCPKNSQPYKSEQWFINHVMTHAEEFPSVDASQCSDQPVYCCNWWGCKFVSFSGPEMRKHIVTCHVEDRIAKNNIVCRWKDCPKYGSEYQLASAFQKHVLSEHVAAFPEKEPEKKSNSTLPGFNFTFGQTSSTEGLFGAPTTSSTGLFSAAPASTGANLFGTQATTPAPPPTSTFIFGSNPSPSTGGSLFGNQATAPAPPPTSTFSFGSNPSPSTGGSLFGNQANAPACNFSFGNSPSPPAGGSLFGAPTSSKNIFSFG